MTSVVIENSRPKHDPLGPAVFGALILHALIILGVSFDIEDPTRSEPERTLDITLVKPTAKPEEPEEAQFLAQQNNLGGGEEISKERSTSPFGAQNAFNTDMPKPQQKKAAAPKQENEVNRKTLTSKKSEVVVNQEKQKIPTPKKKTINIAQLLAETEVEIDRLTAELDQRAQKASSKKKRKAISASTRESKYTEYMEAWRRKVERIGNLNYPDAARRARLFGSLLMHVSLNADGSIESVRIVKSSGHKILDDAAKRIVQLSSPFAPFPPDIRKDVDILDITRTWQFLNTGKNLFRTTY